MVGGCAMSVHNVRALDGAGIPACYWHNQSSVNSFVAVPSLMVLRSKIAVIICCIFTAIFGARVAQAQDTAPSMAINLAGISDWSTQHPFVNIRRTARPWLGHLEGRWGGISNEQLRAAGHVTEDGWPISIPANATKLETVILTSQPLDFTSIRGRYRVRYQGDVDLSITGAGRNVTRDGNELWFTFPDDASGPVGIALTRINANDPLSDLSIVHEDLVLAHDAGVVFTPQWIEHIRDFRVLRFMDWMSTNNSEVSSWDQLTTTDDFSYEPGMPLSVMLDLANFVGADPWFTLPHMSDDDLVMRFAGQVKAGLKPELKAYVEYSNEVWNFQFQQTRWADEQARALWGRRAGGDAWIQYAGLRAAQVASIFDQTFGDQADARLVNVISVHTGWPDLAAAQLEGSLLRRDWDRAPSDVFDAMAVTGYLRPEADEENLAQNVKDWAAEGGREYAFDKMAADIRATRLKNLREEFWPAHARTAQKHGLDLIMYEGGTHTILPYHGEYDTEAGEIITAFNYSPQMVALYQEAFEDWRDVGGELFNAFVDLGQPSRYGSWGHLRHLDDDNIRWQAVLVENARPDPSDARPPSDFVHGVQRINTQNPSGTALADVLIGSNSDDTITPNGGSDIVHGGDGFDQVILAGAVSDYDFVFYGDRLEARKDSNLTKLTGVEFLFFPDEGFGLFAEDFR